MGHQVHSWDAACHKLSLVWEQELCVVQARLVTAVVVAPTALGINLGGLLLLVVVFLLSKRFMNSMTHEMGGPSI